MLPALVAWPVVAATLGLDAGRRLGVGLGLLVLAALLALPGRRRRPGPMTGPGRHSVLRLRLGPLAALVCAATGLALSAAGLHGLGRDAGVLDELARAGASAHLTGTVASDPAPLDRPGGAGALVRVQVGSVEGRGVRSSVHSTVLVFGDATWSRVSWGQRVQWSGRLAPSAPGDDVGATVSARGPPTVTGRPAAPLRAAERLRAGLRTASAGLSPDPRGLLPGLVVGDTSLQPPGMADAMKATGLTHLAAVSGTNVTIVCLLALGLARAAGAGRVSRLVLAALVLVGFVVLARPEPSVLRAAVMGGLGLLALGTARRRAALPALSAAVVGLLVVDPWLARSFGFALSVLATLGLLVLAPPWTAAAVRRWPRVPEPLLAAGCVPLAAQATCGPVVVLLSAQVSLVSVPANLLAAPFVAPATVIGLAAALASPLSAHLAAALAWVAGWPCLAVTTIARRLADVHGGQLPWPGGARGAVALAGVTVLAVVLARPVGRWAAGHRSAAGGVLTVLVAAAFPLPAGTTGWPAPGWLLVACDVGQGDALVLSTGAGHGVLVDAGPDPAAVDGCLRRLGVRVLDLVVLTHFHADHVDGLPGALAGRAVTGVVTTIVDDPPAQARQVRAWAAAAGVPVRAAVAGERVVVGPVSWQVVWPARVIRDGSVPNNSSVVLAVRTGGLRLLLLGDVEPAAARAVARALAEQPGGAGADVVKVAHHGSALQDPALMAATGARLALVSVGTGNDYGHPAPVTLRLLGSLGMRVARTDTGGDLAVVAHDGLPALATSGPRGQPVGGRR
jgi:competence protein ComEC